MKALLGIDHGGSYRHALSMLGRLNFKDCHVHLATVVHPEVDVVAPIGPGTYSGRLALLDPPERIVDDSRKAAELDLEEATVRAMAIDPAPRTATLFGTAEDQIMKYANDIDADLICANRTIAGALNAFAMGSVCRALTISAKQSVLITKGEVEPKGEIRAVFATDHSPYCNECLGKLLRLHPQGISQVTVLNVNERNPAQYLRGLSGEGARLVLLSGEEHAVEARRRNEKIAEKLESIAKTATPIFREGNAQDAIATTMVETKAELLILGARGHNFFERLGMGSVALHNVVCEDYPVLVIRA